MKCWYLLYCKRGEQARAKLNLENQGIQCYYPEMSSEKLVRGRKTIKREPLFPNYLFIYFDYEQGPSFTTVRSTRGVIDFIRQGGYPQKLQEELISLLQQRESEENRTPALMELGQEVRVKQGRFMGVQAIFQEADGEKRSIMLIHLLSQPISVSIENKDLDI